MFIFLDLMICITLGQELLIFSRVISPLGAVASFFSTSGFSFSSGMLFSFLTRFSEALSRGLLGSFLGADLYVTLVSFNGAVAIPSSSLLTLSSRESSFLRLASFITAISNIILGCNDHFIEPSAVVNV